MGPRMWLALACIACTGCPGVRPRLGYPWVESSQLSLVEEDLRVSLDPRGADVQVGLRFVSERRNGELEMAFPEDRRDPELEELAVRWEDGELPLHAAGPGPAFVPLHGVGRWHVFELPPLEAGGGGWLRVRYRQRLGLEPGGRCRFRYLLRTGAYWRGPIGELRASVQVRGMRWHRASLDGARPRVQSGGLVWLARNLEPRDDLLVETDCPRRDECAR